MEDSLVIKLIEEVEKRPILYDASKKTYRDTGIRYNAWIEVAAEVGVSGE